MPLANSAEPWKIHPREDTEVDIVHSDIGYIIANC